MSNTSSNTNTNTVNNYIKINRLNDMNPTTRNFTPEELSADENIQDNSNLADVLKDNDVYNATNNTTGTKIIKSESTTPLNIRLFKDLFTKLLIDYFKSEIMLLNNVFEITPKIVFKINDLKLLISTLIEVDEEKISIEYEDIFKSGCCGRLCKKVPLFKKVTDITIDGMKSFYIHYNSIAVQLQNEYSISLDYVVIDYIHK
jgi:hypothetical protein